MYVVQLGVTYDMNLDHVLTTLKKKMKLQGAVLVGYWADCPYSCSTKYNAKNGTQLDGYLRFAAAVCCCELVRYLSLSNISIGNNYTHIFVTHYMRVYSR